MQEPKTIYIFLDESGNLDFSRTGTLHYVLAAVVTESPLELSQKMQKLKYLKLEENKDIEYFHASEDKQHIRDDVISEICTMKDDLKVHFIHAQKTKTYPALQNSTAFYGKLGLVLIRFIVGWRTNGFDKVIIVFDKALTNKEQKAFLGQLKPELKKLGKPYRIYFHRTLSDFNGQVADYFAWSKYVSLERNELRPLNALNEIQMTHFDLFARGTKEWY
jgi:hypothetical protein